MMPSARVMVSMCESVTAPAISSVREVAPARQVPGAGKERGAAL